MNRFSRSFGLAYRVCGSVVIGFFLGERTINIRFGMIVVARADAVLIEVVPQPWFDGDFASSVTVRKTLAAKRAAIPIRIITVLFAGRDACFVVFKRVEGVKVTIKFELYAVVGVGPTNVLHFGRKSIVRIACQMTEISYISSRKFNCFCDGSVYFLIANIAVNS